MRGICVRKDFSCGKRICRSLGVLGEFGAQSQRLRTCREDEIDGGQAESRTNQMATD
jgi:hypothetical protein